jgi:4-aminobutyrate aminotransferase-like enzyme
MSYCFVHEQRAELTKLLASLSPDPSNYRVFLLSTGSEAIENAIKLARTWALDHDGPQRRIIVSFENAFHGRTLGAQLAGGMQAQKRWIVGEGATFVQVPFPDGYYCADTSFDLFLKTLGAKGVQPNQIAAVLTETFQGAGVNFFPAEYARSMDRFCRKNGIITIFDEVQSGFGRSGRMFGYEHYGVTPDLIVCGKGITSSLPLSAVIGRKELMSQYPPGSSTSTHSASLLPVAAALASIRLIQRENLVESSRLLGQRLEQELLRIQKRFPEAIGCVHARGLVAGVMFRKNGTLEPDPLTAFQISEVCFRKGLLMMAPVGTYGECHKIAPALVISADALEESLRVYAECCARVLSQSQPVG